MSLPATVEESLTPVELEDTPPPSQLDQELIEDFSLQPPYNYYWNWCWAVVAEGFANFLHPYGDWDQSSIAREACTRGIRHCTWDDVCLCDEPWELHEALNIALGLGVEPDDTEIPFEGIVWEIRENATPVGCRLLQDSGHFGVIVGFKQNRTDQFVTIILNSDNALIDWKYPSFIANRSHFYMISGVNTWKLKYQKILKKTYKFFAKL